MKNKILTLILSLTLCNVAWAQFDQQGGTEGQTDLIVRPPSQPAQKEQARTQRTETEAQRRARLALQEQRRLEAQERARMEALLQGNFQTFSYQSGNINSPVRAVQESVSISYRDITNFDSLIGFVTDNASVTSNATKFAEQSESVVWFFQDKKIRNTSGVEENISVKAFGIDFVRQEWADRFMEVTEDQKVSLFFAEPAGREALIPMHKVIITKPEQKEIYFLPSGMANISESYKDAGMPYAKGKNLVNAFYDHIIQLSAQFNDTGACSIFFGSEYTVNKGVEEQDDGIKEVARLFPQTYGIFSEASDYVHNSSYFYIRDTGVIFSRVDQQCNLTTLWNEYFYYIFINNAL